MKRKKACFDGLQPAYDGFHAVSVRMLGAFLALTLCFCMVPAAWAQIPENDASTFETAQLSESGSGLMGKIQALPGVVDVVQGTPMMPSFLEQYTVTFEQPLDWDNLGTGYFNQRVTVSFRGYGNAVVYYASGYNMNPGSAEINELASRYDANAVEFEYRFFGESVPAGLSNDSADLWQYLTVENAARDFHSIMCKLNTIFTGKTVFTGASKGGFTTNAQAYLSQKYYGSYDCDAYVSFVAPLCEGLNDSHFISNIYETIGETAFPTEQASGYRDTITAFQVECIKYREALQAGLWNKAVEKGAVFRSACTKELFFDMMLLEFGVGIWQGSLLGPIDMATEELEKILAMPTGTQQEIDARNDAILECISAAAGLTTFSTNFFAFPYYVQTALQMGSYYYDFSYLRNAVTAAKLKDSSFTTDVAVKPEQDATIFYGIMFTDDQKAAFTYDPGFRNELVSWSETTDAPLIMVFGGLDPWRAVRIPDNSNPNIHRYTGNASNHGITIAELPEADQIECYSLLDAWLSPSPVEPDPDEPASADSEARLPAETGDAAGFAGAGLLLVAAASVLTMRGCGLRNKTRD